MELAIRAARPRDKRGVFDVIRTIWGGSDYLLHTFDAWVRGRRDRLFVAELDGRIVGVARLAWFSPEDAWLETLRVHPRYRHRGVGRALMRHRIALAEDAGARRIAFSTDSANEPQLRSARRLGFRRIADLEWMVARARTGGPPRRVRAEEEPALWRIARRAAQRAPALIHRDRGWRWQRLARADLAAAIRARRCYASDGPRGIRAFAIVEPDRENDELIVRALVGDAFGAGDLLARLRASAHEHGLTRVSAYRRRGSLVRTFAKSGYRPPWRFTAAYFERVLALD